MPELPEVQTIVSQLAADISGKRIRSAELLHRDMLRHGSPDFVRRIKGKSISSVEREAKRIWIRLEDGGRCLIHLGMSGRIVLKPPRAKLEPHTHFRMRFNGPEKELRLRDPRRFGGIWWFAGGEDSTATLSQVGPDALTIKTNDFLSLCSRQRRIKAILLDQTRIAGLGNIYCDEALFDARIHPDTLASAIPADLRPRLAASVRRVLRKAIDYGGSTLRDFVKTDGRIGEFQNIHRVYGREGQPCVRCKTPIERIITAGRSTHFCPACQRI